LVLARWALDEGQWDPDGNYIIEGYACEAHVGDRLLHIDGTDIYFIYQTINGTDVVLGTLVRRKLGDSNGRVLSPGLLFPMSVTPWWQPDSGVPWPWKKRARFSLAQWAVICGYISDPPSHKLEIPQSFGEGEFPENFWETCFDLDAQLVERECV
jgi:hypothetical protein